MVVDRQGYRLNVGIVLANAKSRLFWGRRIGREAWQFPQGGLAKQETIKEALYRELKEELGLTAEDVELLATTKHWIHYRLPKKYIRSHSKPVVIGQKQKWFLLRLKSRESRIKLDSSRAPEFDSWRWVSYWYPINQVVFFKKKVYQHVLKEFESILFPEK